MTARALVPGEPVEVLQVWAYDTAPEWTSGYRYVRHDPAGPVIVVHVGGVYDGCESAWRAHAVRPDRTCPAHERLCVEAFCAVRGS